MSNDSHSGQIIILNGAPRSGKSSIARAIQEGFEGPWINLGVDSYNAMDVLLLFMEETLIPNNCPERDCPECRATISRDPAAAWTTMTARTKAT